MMPLLMRTAWMLPALMTLALATASAQAGVSADAGITPVQRQLLEGGGQVVTTAVHAQSAWPAVTVRRLIGTSPARAAALFMDYDAHARYIPELTHSRVSRRIDAATAEVDYTMSVPVVKDEEYTVRNRVRVDSAGGFRVDWTLIRATSVQATTGHARFLPFVRTGSRDTVTLLEYHNAVTPGSRLAGIRIIRSRAQRQVETTVEAIRRRAEANFPAAYVDRWLRALSYAVAAPVQG